MSGQIARRAAGALAGVAAIVALAPAGASAATTCTAPTLTEPFASFGDTNAYALAPGETADSFAATGWTLSGGAKLVTTTLYDGTKGAVLDLPSGAKAVSPTMCVTSAYSSARAMVRNVAGTAGIAVSAKYVSSAASTGSTVSAGTFTVSGTAWAPSSVLSIAPPASSGWQSATFTLTASGTKSEYQLYDLYVDPKMRK